MKILSYIYFELTFAKSSILSISNNSTALVAGTLIHNHENSAAKHQAIIDALTNQDLEGAMDAMRQNWADTIAAFQP